MRKWGPVGTVPLGQNRHLHLFREAERGPEEVGGGRRKGRQKYPEREGVGPQFIPTRCNKCSSLLKMQTSSGMVKPNPAFEVKPFNETTLELELWPTPVLPGSAHTPPVLSTSFCSNPPTGIRELSRKALVPWMLLSSVLREVFSTDTWSRMDQWM